MSDTLFANWDAIEIDLNEIIFFFFKNTAIRASK